MMHAHLCPPYRLSAAIPHPMPGQYPSMYRYEFVAEWPGVAADNLVTFSQTRQLENPVTTLHPMKPRFPLLVQLDKDK